MKLTKTMTLAVSTSVLVGIVGYANSSTPVEEAKPSFVVQRQIQNHLGTNTLLVSALHETYEDYTDLKAMYEELEENYRELQGQLDNLLTYPYFTSSDVSIVSNAHVYQMKYALEGTELQSLASTFIQAEKTYKINAFFLAGLVSLESDYGRSDRAVNDNNLSGYAVYNDNSVGRKFASKEESIMETARLISEDYLPEGAKFHTGKSIYEINQMYSADKEWNVKITRIADKFCNKAKMWGVE